MVLLDLLGRKQALRILWELYKGPVNFRELQSRCDDISPTVLNRRLRELRDALIVDHSAERGYALTPLGVELMGHFEPINRWSKKWGRKFPA